MGFLETVDFVRHFAVMVRVNGPVTLYGKTTLSASGMLLPDTLSDADLAKKSWVWREMLRGVWIRTFSLAHCSTYKIGSLDHGWEVGCSLASHDNGPQNFMDVIQTQVLPNVALTPSNRRGDSLLAVGSPFGVLSPLHFFNRCMGSGVLLNDQGLILTNARLLGPWSFGKTTANGRRDGAKSQAVFLLPEESAFPGYSNVDNHEKSHRLQPEALECVSDQLCPIKLGFACPILGSKACVIGHGLFGPTCGFSPSVCSGVVAKIVKAEAPPYYRQKGDPHFPALLETTVAVHPGGSGRFVINPKGLAEINKSQPCLKDGQFRLKEKVPVQARLFYWLGWASVIVISDESGCLETDVQDISLLQNLDQPNQHLSSV
ncbi:hypothetical protein GH714_016518 [Hevea brasiliensis]|uniref:Uncharacterized protein n=1 Tax=Hevea brasiliensis TaxID=3981 RepID=A0A6A6LTC1_HEVBR|nr:hypothetical protein GH714_016518 [Hevea brasiliensis]